MEAKLVELRYLCHENINLTKTNLSQEGQSYSNTLYTKLLNAALLYVRNTYVSVFMCIPNPKPNPGERGGRNVLRRPS